MKSSSKQSSLPTILVADDDPELLSLMSRHLKPRAGKLLEASDGDQALALVEKEHPDLILLDVMMPGRSGWEVCKSIREKHQQKVGIIMLTGIGDKLNELTSPLYGANEYLDKPFDFADLDKAITKVLHRKP